MSPQGGNVQHLFRNNRLGCTQYTYIWWLTLLLAHLSLTTIRQLWALGLTARGGVPAYGTAVGREQCVIRTRFCSLSPVRHLVPARNYARAGARRARTAYPGTAILTSPTALRHSLSLHGYQNATAASEARATSCHTQTSLKHTYISTLVCPERCEH